MNLGLLKYEVAMHAPVKFTSSGEEFTECYVVDSVDVLTHWLEHCYLVENLRTDKIYLHYNTRHWLDCFAWCQNGKIKEIYAHVHTSRIGVRELLNDTVPQLAQSKRKAA